MFRDYSKEVKVLAEVFSKVYGAIISEALAKRGINAEIKDLFNPETLASAIKCKRVLVVTVSKISADTIMQAESLEMIQRVGVGVDNIDLDAATQRGVVVCNTPTAMTESVAQHIWGFITAHSKRIVEGDQLVKRGGWSTLIGYELKDKTLALVGFGNIGQRTAEIAHAFGMNVLAYDPYQKDEVFQKKKVERVELREALQRSDILVLTLPLTRETVHMIGEKEISLMKRTALLINVSRGGILDERALIRALKEGWIAGAALDVYEQEPLPSDSPLLKLKNVILTPHSAGSTFESLWRAAEMAADNVARFLRGEKPRWIVNPTALDLR